MAEEPETAQSPQELDEALYFVSANDLLDAKQWEILLAAVRAKERD